MLIAISIFTALTFALLVWVLWMMAALDERQEELDNYSAHLDEKRNRLKADEEALRDISELFKRDYDAFLNRDIYSASYTETDSDVMRYSTNALMAAHAKKHLANTISQDIVKQFNPVEDKTEDGRRRFTYKFKIAEQ